jgi:hypothetical protein
MFSMFTCCDPEPAEKPHVIYSSTDEHVGQGALPNLLPSKSKELVKTKPELMPSAPPAEELDKPKKAVASVPPPPLKEPALPASPPTVTKDAVLVPSVADLPADVERSSTAQPEVNNADLPRDLTEPEAETEATSPGAALRESPATEEPVAQAQGEASGEMAPLTDDDASLEHLQEIVAEFSKKAVSGAASVYVNEKTAKRSNVTYTMTSDLTQLTIAAEKKGIFAPFSLTVPIASIQDTDEFEGCQDLLRPKLKATLTKDEMERFLMVFYEDKKGELKSVCLIEQSVESKNQFSTGLKMLASSMQK